MRLPHAPAPRPLPRVRRLVVLYEPSAHAKPDRSNGYAQPVRLCADIRIRADSRRLPLAIERVRPRPRRRHRPRLAGPDRRRPGRRQVHAAHPARRRGRKRTSATCCTSRAKSPWPRSACARVASGLQRARSAVPERDRRRDHHRRTHAPRAPRLLVVDSIQSVMVGPTSTALPGSVTQLRESAQRLMQLAKSSGVPIFLVGHVTKDGAIAGPKAARAHGRHRAVPRGRARPAVPTPAQREESFRIDQRGGCVRDARRGPGRGA